MQSGHAGVALAIAVVGGCLMGLAYDKPYLGAVGITGAVLALGGLVWWVALAIHDRRKPEGTEAGMNTGKNPLTCCEKPSWASQVDLGHAGGFEYMLGKCDRCGAHWMNVFCVATGTTGLEPVSMADVERMKSIPVGPELKAFMRSWGDKNL